jgi:hypothetical protein
LLGGEVIDHELGAAQAQGERGHFAHVGGAGLEAVIGGGHGASGLEQGDLGAERVDA